jgi:hypothetical protein
MPAEEDAVEVVGSLMAGFVDSRCLHVVANIGVADVVGEDPMPIAELAAELGVNSKSLTRLLRHLVTLGVFSVRGDRVAHNEASRLLRSDHPLGLLETAQLMALPIMWDSVRYLEDAVRTGRPGTVFHDQRGFFGYLADHPDESAVYDRGMTSMTMRRIAAQVPAYDFSRFGVIADIGGGRGHLIRAILERTPQARGIVFDQEHVVKDAVPHDRLTALAGSFFVDPLPGADCYVLSNIVHDWADDEARAILRSVREAAAADSTLLLMEFVVPEGDEGFEATDIDIDMLILVGGRERTEREYAELLEYGGWRLTRTIPTERQTLLEAHPAR